MDQERPPPPKEWVGACTDEDPRCLRPSRGSPTALCTCSNACVWGGCPTATAQVCRRSSPAPRWERAVLCVRKRPPGEEGRDAPWRSPDWGVDDQGFKRETTP